MDANDERWDIFLEAYAKQKAKLDEAIDLVGDILSHVSGWLDEVPREWWIDYYTLKGDTEALEEMMEDDDHGAD